MKRILSFLAAIAVAPVTLGVEINDQFDAAKPSFWDAGYEQKLDKTFKLSGSGSLAFLFKGVPDGTDSNAEQRFRLPAKMSEVYLQYDLYIPPNYYHRKQGGSFGSDNNKGLVTLWSGDYTGSGHNTFVGFEQWATGDGGSKPSIRIFGGGVDQGHVHTNKMDVSGDVISVPEDLGRWRNFKVHIKMSAGTASNGLVEVWKDGKLIIKKTGIKNNSKSGNYLDKGYLLGWSNSGFAKNTTLYIDNFSVSGTGFADDGSTVGVPPAAPTLQLK